MAVVYALLSSSDRVLYVGTTTNLLRRLAGHAGTQAWWDRVRHVAWYVVEPPLNRYAVEAAVIYAVNPKYNVQQASSRDGVAHAAQRRADRWYGKTLDEVRRAPRSVRLLNGYDRDRWIDALVGRTVTRRRFAV